MADELIEHRFVQIHQACESASEKPEEFWNKCAQAPTIAVSHGCEKIYSRVTQQEDVNLLQTIQSLQNLILTSEDLPKTVIYLHTLTRLLAHNEHSSSPNKIQFYHSRTESQQQIHPYAFVMRQKPALYSRLLEEVDYVILNETTIALPLLEGFVTAVILTENSVDINALLSRLTTAIMTIGVQDSSTLLQDIYQYMIQLLYSYPLHRDDAKYFSLLDFLTWITVISKPFQELKGDRTNLQVDKYIYSFIDRMVTATSEECSVISYLTRLERLRNNIDKSAADIIWVSIVYMLLKSQTLDEQLSIMRLMKSVLCDCTCSVARIAYLPLYQLLSELNDKNASKEIKALKEDTLDILSVLDSERSFTVSKEKASQSLQDIISKNKLYGLLGHILVYLDSFYRNKTPLLEDSQAHGSDTTLALTMLFGTPFVFDTPQETQMTVYTRIVEVCLKQKTSYKFAVLLFLLRRLRACFDDALVVAHIFKDVIPMLASTNDPTITSKVLQVILSSINSSGDVMASLGVKALARTHSHQPRVWQELKRVFAEWVLRRKSGTLRRKIDLSNSGPIKMELAVLTSMRDVCKHKPRECGPDVLPMVISLLQTCQDLSMASLSLLMGTINYCIKAGLVEPRSIWNIAVVYLAQYSMNHGVQQSTLLVKQICHFYSIAGARNDISEPYLQFKQNLLTDFILPLIDSDDKKAAAYAMRALADFTAQDIAAILPEKAAEYLQKAVSANDEPNESQHSVLSTLMSNELDHMRRGLFKEESSIKKPSVQQNDNSKKQVVNDAGQVIGERELELQRMFAQIWEDARVAPGLRSGYAIAILNTLEDTSSSKGEVTMEAISKTKWYRFMVTSFTDVSLTDHLLLRVSSVGSWQVFFQNALSDTKNEMEPTVSLLLKDLMSRLERSTVPGVTCNIAMAMTGLVLVVRLFAPAFATLCASNIIETLMKNYIVLSGSPLSHSAHLMSEEVQFAARFALGYLASCVISDEKTTRTIYQVLIDSATSSNSKYRNIDTSVDLVQFANGYAAGHFVASLTVYPTMTDYVENMKDNGLASLQNYCGQKDASDSRVIGILMGLSSSLKPSMMCDAETVSDELNFANNSLKQYLAGESISKGLLLGSVWIVGLGALQEYGVEYEFSNVVESVMEAASRDATLAQHFYHFVVPYSQILYHGYIHADANDEAAASTYTQSFEPLFSSIQSDDASSNYRIASLFGIGCLLGADYFGRSIDGVYTEAQRYNAASRRAGLDKLAAVAGLTVKSAPTGNLKSGRVAAATCGKVLSHANSMLHTLDTNSADNTSHAADPMALASVSSEPSNYNRLNSNTSYLRAVFDMLVQLSVDAASNVHNVSMLLQSLIDTPGPLPPVNWFALLVKLSKVSSSMRELCFTFACTHAATSFSLSEFILTQSMSLLGNEGALMNKECDFLFVGNAFSTILDLGGLPSQDDRAKDKMKRRGMTAVVKKISISGSRILEVLAKLADGFKLLSSDIQYEALNVLAKHLPSEKTTLEEDQAKLVSSVRTLVHQSITIPVCLDSNDVHEETIVKAVACGEESDIEKMFPSGKPDNWYQMKHVANHFTYLCEAYRLSADKKQVVKYVSTAIVYLISAGAADNATSWRILSDMIAADSSTEKSALGWIIRILDAFVVYLSGVYHVEESHEVQDAHVMQGVRLGLYSVLMRLYSDMEPSQSADLQVAETAYLLDYYVNMGGKHLTEQEQVVKRVLKLLGMTNKLQVNNNNSVDFFRRVALGLPSTCVDQYEPMF